MRNGDRPAMAAVLPYAIWMGLLFGLPATAECYAVRTALTAAAISVAVRYGADAFAPWWSAQRARGPILWGLGIGLLVCFLWIFPERFAFYRDFSLLGALGLGGGELRAEALLLLSRRDAAIRRRREYAQAEKQKGEQSRHRKPRKPAQPRD